MPIKIIGFKIEGARCIKAMEMEVASNGLIQFAGLNEQGKSTILDSLEYLFCGASAWNENMITDGEARMKVEAIIEGEGTRWEITRTGTKKSQGIKIKNLNTGAKINRPPQAFLDELVNQLTWNPFPFKYKTATEKAKFIMKLFNIDFTEENKKLEGLRTERLLYGKAARSYGVIPGQLEVKPVDLGALMMEKKIIDDHNTKLKDAYQTARENKLKEITKFNTEQQKTEDAINSMNYHVETSNEVINEIDAKILELQQQRKGRIELLAGYKTRLLELPEPLAKKPMDSSEVKVPQYKSTGEVDAKIGSAKKNNENYQEYVRIENRRNAQAEEQVKYDATTEKIQKIENDKQTKLLGVKVPVPDLKLTEDGITYKGRGPENWSSSEEMTIAAALCEGKAPRLAAVFLDGAETYDKPTRKVLERWAKDKDIQCFITLVRDEIPENIEPGVFYIHDGAIVNKEK